MITYCKDKDMPAIGASCLIYLIKLNRITSNIDRIYIKEKRNKWDVFKQYNLENVQCFTMSLTDKTQQDKKFKITLKITS